MSEPQGSIPQWSGRLDQTPLFAVLRRIQRARVTGTLWLSRHEEERWLHFEDGELRAARSSKEEHHLGTALVRWGYVAQKDVERALAMQRERGLRLDKVLVEMGLVNQNVLDTEAKRLMEHIVSSALSWEDGSFRFQPGAGCCDEDPVSLSLTEMIIEGICRIPESQEFLDLLGDLSRIPILAGSALSGSDSTRLPADAFFLLSRIDGRTDAQNILRLVPASRLAAAKTLYMLAYCGFVELRASAARPEPAAAPAIESEQYSPQRTFLRATYRRIDWLSHYDLLRVRAEATEFEIEQAYRRLAPLFDPALRARPAFSDCGRELTVLSERLRLAHETLSDPALRDAYDQSIWRAQALFIEGSNLESSESPQKLRASSEKVRRETASRNYRRAQELIEEKDFFPAIQMLEEAVRFAPDNASYRHLLGRTKLKNRWWQDEGIEQLEEAARISPARADIQASLAEAYLGKGALEKALACARTALNVAPLEEKAPYRDLELRVEEALQLAESEHPTLVGRLLEKV